MYREGEGNIYCNFHDEKEWRFIPDISIKNNLTPLMINKIYTTTEKEKRYNQAISHMNKHCIEFSFDKIKYIIVSTRSDRENIIDFINKEFNMDLKEKLILASKILVFERIEEDW